jgi:hypothetical protein
MFAPDVTWTNFAAAPARPINAGLFGIDSDAPLLEDPIPLPAHPYANDQVYAPQPA